MTIVKTLQARQTSKGLRIWLEGNDLSNIGFTHGATYNVDMGSNDIVLYLDTNGKRKVAGSQSRPVIDLQSKKIGDIFREGHVIVHINNGIISIDQEEV